MCEVIETVCKEAARAEKEKAETEEKTREPEQSKENLCDGRRPLCLARVLNEKKPLCGCVCVFVCVCESLQ